MLYEKDMTRPCSRISSYNILLLFFKNLHFIAPIVDNFTLQYSKLNELITETKAIQQKQHFIL